MEWVFRQAEPKANLLPPKPGGWYVQPPTKDMMMLGLDRPRGVCSDPGVPVRRKFRSAPRLLALATGLPFGCCAIARCADETGASVSLSEHVATDQAAVEVKAGRFHTAVAAEQAIVGWQAVVTGQGDTSQLPLQEVGVPAAGLRIAALLTAAGLTVSNSEAGRKLGERAVRVQGEVVVDARQVFAPGFEGVLQVGKRRFARILLVREG